MQTKLDCPVGWKCPTGVLSTLEPSFNESINSLEAAASRSVLFLLLHAQVAYALELILFSEISQKSRDF